MIKHSERKQFQKVLVYKLDRFSRDEYDPAIYKASTPKKWRKRSNLQLRIYQIILLEF